MALGHESSTAAEDAGRLGLMIARGGGLWFGHESPQESQGAPQRPKNNNRVLLAKTASRQQLSLL
jgi:hypothetical protein